MKLLALFVALACTLQPAFAADDKKPEDKKSPREKREEAKEKEKQQKRQEEIKKETEKRKKGEEERKKKEEKSGLPAKPTVPPKKQKTDMIDEDVVALLKPYDTNSDFEIDVEEFKAVETEFKKNPKGPLKSFDKANDGTLDAMFDRTGINVKLGAAAPKTKKIPAPAKKPEAAKPAPAPAPAPPEKPAAAEKPAEKKP